MTSLRLRTALLPAGLIITLAAIVLLSGCAKPAPPVPPSLELARPVQDLTAVRQGDRVVLNFTVVAETTDGERFKAWGPIRVCRSVQAASEPAVMDKCSEVVGAIPVSQLGIEGNSPKSDRATMDKSGIHQDQSTRDGATNKKAKKDAGTRLPVTFVDRLPADLERQNARGEVGYAIEIANRYDRSAGLGNVARVAAAPAVTANTALRARVGPTGVELAWAAVKVPAMDGVSFAYRVYRREAGKEVEGVKVCKVAVTSGDGACLDVGMTWEQSYEYSLAVVTKISGTGGEVEGDASEPVQVMVHDVFPPAVPVGVQAVASGVGQAAFVDLTWGPDTDVDLAGYNVYRREEGGLAVKLNEDPVAAPSYRDIKVTAGKKYIYQVSAVDVRGNESAKSDEAGETVP